MKHRLRKIIFGAIFAAVVGGGNFFVGAPEVRAANTDCCVYTLVPASKPPAWLSALGDASAVFVDGSVKTACKKPSEIVVLSQKKIDQYYDYNGGDAIPGDCSKTADYAAFVKAAVKTECCQVNNGTDVLRGCVDINKANVAKSEVAASCILAAHSKFMPDDKILAFNQACSAVTACQDLQKKFDDQKALNKVADAQAAEIIKRMEDGMAGKKKSWTKDECGSVLRRDASGPAYIWMPPPSAPNAVTGNYCYVRTVPTNLQVNVGSTSVIAGMAEYINVAYKYGLGIGVIVMIVVIVFSGIQWMLSGIASSINDSKERIKNAALGLLLLFAANTILYTINPQLLTMKLPMMQAIRPETFTVENSIVDGGTRCDPAEEDSCSKMGKNFKCKPTSDYAAAKCATQMKVFIAAGVIGGIAGGAYMIGPLLSGGAGAWTAVQAPAGNAVASTVTKEVVESVPDVAADIADGVANNKSAAETAMNVGVDLIPAGDKATKIIGAVTIGLGLAIAANAYADSEEAKNPALGYCVPFKSDKPDGAVCNVDGECINQKCLITSTAACGAGEFGVCTNGELRQACALPKLLSSISGLGDAAYANKFGCKAGHSACVDNGRGATSKGVGICSDGSGVGMTCSSNVPCKSSGNLNLECIQGLCREKGFYSASGKTVMLKPGATCVVGSDCSDVNSQAQAILQNTPITGCLKFPSASKDLPGRFLVSQMNGKVDLRYFRELDSYGVCQSDRSYFIERADLVNASSQIKAVVPQTCFVNIYPRSSLTESEQKVADYLTANSVSLGPAYSKGFVMRYVGCQTGTACRIRAADFAKDSVKGKDFVSVKGACSFIGITDSPSLSSAFASIKMPIPNGIALLNDPMWGTDSIFVGAEDTVMNKISTPNLVDLGNTFAGESTK